ncbi:MAG: hypothetical protein A7316_06195 [Candidatus Altiarchaeales archaeon WOR_SM1_86-2]|nr:MAG: hypothetical protein A7316_06195 [Candidatus Altiarchaeales archaeon WOR_SM1_86-2]ODS41628.1 MAG: hypothetical protein A7315_00985 [Candidatus Altiarchaeales archaeon WOR_SM1_79]
MKTLHIIILAAAAIFLLIFIVVIFGVALWYIGVFNLGEPAKTFTGFGAVKPLSWAVYEDGSGVITMTSGEGAPVTITDVSGDCTFKLPADTHISPGDVFRITATDCGTGTAGSDVYRVDVSVEYTKEIAGVKETHMSSGRISGPYE